MSSDSLVPLLITNGVSIALIIAAVWRSRLARWLFVLVFGVAGLFNIYTAINTPSAYHSFGDLAVVDIYRRFISGFFADFTREVVILAALGQICVAALLSTRGPTLGIGVVGGVIFFVSIMPLCTGAAFPAPALLIIAMIIMWRSLTNKGV